MSEKPVVSLGPVAAPAAGASSIAKPPEKKPEKSFGEVLAAMGKEAKRGEKLIQRVSAGAVPRDASAGELIALQAGVYRYVEGIDLSSKLVDRATQGAKTLVQGGSGGGWRGRGG